jgi:hypothetical protein
MAALDANYATEQLYIQALDAIKNKVKDTADSLELIIPKQVIPEIKYKVGTHPTAELSTFISQVITNPIKQFHDDLVNTTTRYSEKNGDKIKVKIETIESQINRASQMISDEQVRLPTNILDKFRVILEKINDCSKEINVDPILRSLAVCYDEINHLILNIPNDISKFNEILSYYKTIHDKCIHYLDLFKQSKDIKDRIEGCNLATNSFIKQIPSIELSVKNLIQGIIERNLLKANAELEILQQGIRIDFNPGISSGNQSIVEISNLLPDQP